MQECFMGFKPGGQPQKGSGGLGQNHQREGRRGVRNHPVSTTKFGAQDAVAGPDYGG